MILKFHTQDPSGKPLAGVFISAVGDPGPWQAITDANGDFTTPEPGLATGHYDITYSKIGFIDRTIPSDVYDSGEIKVGLEYAVSKLTRLKRDGRFLVDGLGRRHHYRAVTAFRLVQMVHNGEDITPFLNWCVANKAGIRVLAMCKNMFDLSPSDGRAALATLLGVSPVYTEVCCLADTFAYNEDWGAHVQSCGEIAADFVNSLIEGCNEPLQHWQPFTPGQLQSYIKRIVSVPCTLGGPDGDQDESTAYLVPESSYGVSHTARSGDGWRVVRHIREQQVIADANKIYMIDDEPENADKLTEAQLFAAGAIASVCRIGQTHHEKWGKFCTIPNDEEQKRFDARRRGWETVPDEFIGTFANFGWTAPNPESPIQSANFLDDNGRAYSSVTPNEAYVALSNANSPKWKSGWHADRIDGIDNASVYHCVK